MKKGIVLFLCLVCIIILLPACESVDFLPGTGISSEAETVGTTTGPQTMEGEGKIDDYYIKIVGAETGKDYGGEEVLIVTYEWTNQSHEDQNFSFAFSDKAFQNGTECSPYTLVDGIESDKLLSDIKPGTTLTVQQAYLLQDHSDVTVEVTALIDFGNSPIVTKTFSLQ